MHRRTWRPRPNSIAWKSLEYRKGPYFAKNGDFSAAGSADIVYRSTLDAPFAALTLGQRGYQRLVGGGSTDVGTGLKLLGAVANGPQGEARQCDRARRRQTVLTNANPASINARSDGSGTGAVDCSVISTLKAPRLSL